MTDVLVRMTVGISGGRHDGRPWPPQHATIAVPDWEAADLIRGGNAVPVSEDELAAWRESVAQAAAAAEAEAQEAVRAAQPPAVDPVQLPGRAPAEAEAAQPETAAVDAPGPASPKQAWIDYAVHSHGADPDTAERMTKADLMSRYGGRL